jgi:hypothetical protein
MTTPANGPATQAREIPTFDFDQPVEATGVDIPPGNYPGVLRRFGECIYLKSQFKDEEQLRMEVEFAVRVKDGSVQVVGGLMTPPHKGKSGLEVNRKSNLFKLVTAAMADAVNKDGQFVKGFKLNDIVGKPVLVEVAKNAKEFATLKGISAPVDGLKYPTPDEVKALVSEEIPF